MLNVLYDPFLTSKTPFLLCSYFHAHPTELLLKILGGTNAWAVPHLKFLGRRSRQSSLGLRLWFNRMLIHSNTTPPFCHLVTQILQSLHVRSCPASLEQTPASIATNI